MSDTPRTDALSKTAEDIYALDVDSAALWAADYAALCGTLEHQNAELLAVLKFAREEIASLPRSFAYDVTHLPRIDEAIRRAEG